MRLRERQMYQGDRYICQELSIPPQWARKGNRFHKYISEFQPSLTHEQHGVARIFVIYRGPHGEWCGLPSKKFFENIFFFANVIEPAFEEFSNKSKIKTFWKFLISIPERIKERITGLSTIEMSLSSGGGIHIGHPRTKKERQREQERRAKIESAITTKRNLLREMVADEFLRLEIVHEPKGEVVEGEEGVFQPMITHEVLFPTEKFIALILRDMEQVSEENVTEDIKEGVE